MRKKIINSAILILVMFGGIIYGIIIHKYEVFPYKIIRNKLHSVIYPKPVKEKLVTNKNSNFYDMWSIGIFEGSYPFDLSSSKDVTNPILTAKDIVDIEASYVADPFMIIDNNKYYIFFEVFNWDTYQGDIAYAESNDCKSWNYKKVIIDETFHLSYPYTFKWKDDYYLIPESHEDLSIRLYRAVSFPDKWEYTGNLIAGYHFVDPSIIWYHNMWWLFVATTPDDGVLNLYYSNKLSGEWKAHPMNPIVKLDKHIARPAGRLLIYNDNLYRMAQDSYIEYGQQVFAFEITELTEETYSEKIVSKNPIVTRSGLGWNAAGMHHVDLHKIGETWIGISDGKKHSHKNNKKLEQSDLRKIH